MAAIVIANAITPQVANAIEAFATFAFVKKTPPEPVFAPDQPHRIRRLADLLAHEEFAGNQAALGRFLGYSSGAYVRQMLAGERPILEKTIIRVETQKGGKFAGWFSKEAPFTAPAMKLAALFDALPSELRESTYAIMLSQIDFAVATAQSATAVAAQGPTERLLQDH